MLKINKIKLIFSMLLICVCISCLGCVDSINEKDPEIYGHNMTKIDVSVPVFLENGVYRFEDSELNVTCWFVIKDGYGSHGGTVSCIPNSQLDW